MARRPMEGLPPAYAELLEQMRSLRFHVCRVRANAPIFDEAQELMRAIDRLACALTGDPEYFWSKPHNLAQGPK